MSGDISIQSVGGKELIGPHQIALDVQCYERGWPLPTYSLFSDRRGTRTAWSCSLTLGPTLVTARFWYDGRWIRNAREDAAWETLRKIKQHDEMARREQTSTDQDGTEPAPTQ